MDGDPTIIQGGMGVAVSNYRLARAVSRLGQLGVISGTALDQVFVRRLQDGDSDGETRFALAHFPVPEMAQRAIDRFFIPGGKPAGASYLRLPQHTKVDDRELRELCILSNFVEIFLARRGHSNPVGVNYLEKVQIPHLPSIYGAMLAGAGYVLMGAGIPVKIPGVLDAFVHHQPAIYPLHVAGALEGDDVTMTFDPREYVPNDLPPLERPKFLAIISSNVLAATMVKKANGRVDGFVIEGPTAGGHNAPPRGKLQLDESGEVIYGERDQVDLSKIRQLGLPFWLAGGYGSPEKLREALAAGAAGVQVGTAFAFCEESGMRDDYKRAILDQVMAGDGHVSTDAVASPTNFPFKVVRLEGSLSDPEVYAARPRICDLGFLREAYRTDSGAIDYRCSAEPVSLYVSKGGKPESTEDRKCLCNTLLATIGQPQVRNGKYTEPGLVTSGFDLPSIVRFLAPGETSYHASDVIRILQ
jgi:nitronate monooxygenase